MNTKPTFHYEQELWDRGYDFVIGIDEVGRGAFAGPVVVGAIAFAPQNQNSKFKDQSSQCGFLDIQTCGIDDSKRLSAKKREQLEPLIKTHALCWSLGMVDVPVINRIGIGKATEMAMRKAIACILNYEVRSMNYGENSHPDRSGGIFQVEDFFPLIGTRNDKAPFLLIDAFNLKHVPGIGLKNQLAIVKGDQQSISIAAASILAKVYRDKLMCELGNSFASYRWESNKGYGTADHRQAIKTHGSCKHHRAQFVETWMGKQRA